MKKKLKSLVGLVILIVTMSTISVFASSTYSGTYSMYGGVFTQTDFNVTSLMRIDVYPKKGNSNVNLDMYKATYSIWGWSIGENLGSVSSINNSSTFYQGSGKFYVYFRNWAGNLWEGSFKIIWN